MKPFFLPTWVEILIAVSTSKQELCVEIAYRRVLAVGLPMEMKQGIDFL
jgi:hypothetical protein